MSEDLERHGTVDGTAVTVQRNLKHLNSLLSRWNERTAINNTNLGQHSENEKHIPLELYSRRAFFAKRRMSRRKWWLKFENETPPSLPEVADSSQIQPFHKESKSDSSEIKEPVSVPYTTPEEEFSSEEETEELVVRAQSTRRTTAEETENVGGFASHIPTVELARGPSRKKGKGAVDPTNWGDVSFLKNFAESKMNSQKVALDNSTGISRAEEHKRVTTPCEVLVDVSVPHRPKPDAGNAESHPQAPELDGQQRQFNYDASKLKPSAPKADMR
ncbi:hypothetical protein C8R46DRAFT_1284021 [Mycena filopes]|nr:hypothetical protein C8R46DRAFT_1284021 [Mycena filopes]